MPRIQVALGSLPMLSFELGAGSTTLGRSLTSDIVLPLPDVADFHLTLRAAADGVAFEAGAGETVLLNGRAFQEGRLGAHDVVAIGPYGLRLLEGERGEISGDDATIASTPPPPEGVVRRLVVVDGPDTGQEVFVDGAFAGIGRAPDCDLALHDGLVSWRHATLERTPLGTRLRDLGSRNGTLLAGHRVEWNRQGTWNMATVI